MRTLAWIFLLASAVSFAFAQSVEEGIAFFNKGRFGEAKSAFESVIKKDDGNAEAHYRLGLVFLTRQYRDDDEAVDHMEKAVEINEGKADYQYGLGAAYGMKAQNAGIIKQALLAPKIRKAFEKAVALNPKLLEAHVGLAQYYWKAPGIMGGDMEKAWREADEAIQIDEVRGRQLKANMLVGEKKSAEAVQEMKTLVANRPGDWKSWRAAGVFYLQNQITDDAIASFERFTALRPDTSQSFQLLAQAHLQKKNADKAVECAQKALALETTSMSCVAVAAQAYELKGQKREARDQYQRLLLMDLPKDQRKNVEKKIQELQ
ncbi:MAG TPA: tetratricopeptide repeat protein [Bacteroidota bacterium]|nr:tetratricopeptide repeat protein [Bacteroidota bacterium]